MKLSRPLLAILAALFLFAWLLPANRTLVRPDEGRYTEIAREMAISGDYVTPRLNGLKYFEKPPLQYWATAAAFSLFGQSDAAARWWPSFAGLLTLLFVFLGARAFADAMTAWAATAMLGAMAYFFIIAHINTVDMGLTAFMTLTLVGLARGFGVAGQSAGAARGWMVAAWAGAALAFLSKGLIGIVLPGAVFVLYVLITRQWRLLGRLEWFWGPLGFLLIALPWPLLVQSRNPEWTHFFFIYEHFGRFSQEEHERLGAVFYFVPILIIGLMPWTPAVLALLRRQSWGNLSHCYRNTEINLPLLLAIWCAFIFLFFTASKSKLPSYLLPVTPAFALLLAPVLLTLRRRSFHWLLGSMCLIPVTLVVLALFRGEFVNAAYTQGMVDAFAVHALIGAFGFALAAYVAWRLNGRGRRADAVIVAAVVCALSGSVASSGYEHFAPSTSVKYLLQDFRQAEPSYQPTDAFYSVGLFEQTLQPYLQRYTIPVDWLDELGLGAATDPDRVRFNFDDFVEEWQALERGYAITDGSQLPRLDHAGVDYRIVAADLRRIIIARHGVTP
ncbi:MAG: glycosyltransferase family 39 protein [Burkholderiales bacterium]|nr:glycosyltransferase family 39 protein [Burkholderiales bacterium]